MRSATPAIDSDRVFHVHSVSKVYHMGDVDVRALRSLELDLLKAEFVVFISLSGSGKSTLLNILGGIRYSNKYRTCQSRHCPRTDRFHNSLIQRRQPRVGDLLVKLIQYEQQQCTRNQPQQRCGDKAPVPKFHRVVHFAWLGQTEPWFQVGAGMDDCYAIRSAIENPKKSDTG